MQVMEYMDKIAPTLSSGLQNMVLSNPVGLFFIDTSGRLSFMNSRASEIFGCNPDDVGDTRPLSHLEFFFSPEITQKILRLISDQESLKVKCFPGTNLDGHFGYYSLACNRANDQNGRTTGILGLIEDVGEQVKKQQELGHRIEELSVLSQISQVISSTLDTEEVLKVILTGVTARQGLGFNRAFLFLLDDETGQLTGRLAIGPANAEEAGKIWSSLERDDRSLLEILSLYQEESEKSHRSLTDLIKDMRIDITGPSLFAQAIQLKSPVVIEDDTRIDAVTSRLLDRLGEKRVAMTPLVSRDRPIGLLMVDNAITHEEITDYDRQFLKLIADQTATAVERSYLYRDIKERALELEKTNRKLAEIQVQIIEAEKMSVIGEITAAVAHELRNPLTIIGGFANLMNKGVELDSSDSEYVNIIISETQRAEAVLTDVLDFSRASKTRDTRLDLNGLTGKLLDMLKVRLGTRRCNFHLTQSNAPLPVWGNPDQLLHAFYQVFWTLLQDLPCDSPRISTYAPGDTVRLEICFTEFGCERGQIDKILRQYFGANKSTKRLSLIVAEETFKYHGGSLGLETHSEEGPVLYIQLPLHKEE